MTHLVTCCRWQVPCKLVYESARKVAVAGVYLTGREFGRYTKSVVVSQRSPKYSFQGIIAVHSIQHLEGQ